MLLRKRGKVMKKNNGDLSMIDFIILGTPIAFGAALILPFVVFDVAKELIIEKRNRGR